MLPVLLKPIHADNLKNIEFKLMEKILEDYKYRDDFDINTS
jgi:hypothetical protein